MEAQPDLTADRIEPARRAPVAIRSAPRLVKLTALAALLALAAVPMPILLGPALVSFGALAILTIADLRASRRDRAPSLVRMIPERMVKGRPASIAYRISRVGSPTTVAVLDELPADLGGDLIFAPMRIADGASLELSREILPRRRGLHRLGPVYLLWTSSMGLLRFRIKIALGGTVAIIPPAATPNRGALSQRSLRDQLGTRPRPARGEGSEFESMREYTAGDDPRHVDWHASARRRRLIVRQYQTERRHTVILAIDTGRLMAARVDGSSKLDHALDCAVALARASNEFGDRVGLVAFDRELRLMVRPKAGRGAIAAIVEATLALEAAPFEPNYRVLAENLARFQKKRALVVVLTDFVEGSASRELEAYLSVVVRRHLVLLVALRDRILADADRRDPEITRERLYRKLALQDLVAEREAAIGRIARFGAQTLDLDPARINAPVLNRYLAVRQAGLL
jgi:uncharacterized protein (DUF58 family)